MGSRGALRLSLHITFLVRGLQTFGVAHRRSADPMLRPFGSSWLGSWLSSQGHGAGSGQLPDHKTADGWWEVQMILRGIGGEVRPKRVARQLSPPTASFFSMEVQGIRPPYGITPFCDGAVVSGRRV